MYWVTTVTLMKIYVFIYGKTQCDWWGNMLVMTQSMKRMRCIYWTNIYWEPIMCQVQWWEYNTSNSQFTRDGGQRSFIQSVYIEKNCDG